MTGGKRRKNGGVVRDAFCIRTIDCNAFCIQIKMGLTAVPFVNQTVEGLDGVLKNAQMRSLC